MQHGDGYHTRRWRPAPGGTSRGGDAALPGETSELLRAASLPNAGRGKPTGALSSVTVSTRSVSTRSVARPRSGSLRRVLAPRPVPPSTSATPRAPEPSGGRRLPSARRAPRAPCSPPGCGCGCRGEVNCCEPPACRRPSTAWSERAGASKVRDPPGFTVEDGGRGASGGSFGGPPSLPLHRSRVHLQLPLQSSFSVVFRDKPLVVPLEGPESRGAVQRRPHRSTCSLRLAASPRARPPARLDAAAETESSRGAGGRGRVEPTPPGGRERGAPGCGRPPRGRAPRRAPQPKQQRPGAAEGPPSARSGDYKANDSETLLEILSFREAGRRPAEARGGNGDEDPRDASSQSNLRLHSAGGAGPVNPGEPHGVSFTTGGSRQRTVCYGLSPSTAGSPDGPSDHLTLKEALELRRPDFIRRSQERLRRMEQRAGRRRRRRGGRRRSRSPPEEDPGPDEEQGPEGGDAGQRRRNCTTPHPLSDNLFQPRERSISGREMQLRSRRMYNKLPEVARRREEQRKKALSQSNRLRAEVFKQRLLDQVLQR